MIRTVKRIPTIVLLVACSLISGCGQTNPAADNGSDSSSTPDQINFGIIATESTVGLRKELDPFLEDMSVAIGIPVKSFFASDYAGVIEAMRFGKVDLGWFGNKSAIEAVDRADGEVFAQTVRNEGEAGYWSTIIVHTESPYRSPDDLLRDAPKLAFGNGDPHSTSGFLIPGYYLWREYGIDPKKKFKTVVNSNHETNALSVANKQVDFATCSTEVLAQIEAQRPEIFAQLRIVWKSPMIPSDPFVLRKGLPGELKIKIRDFILSYGLEGPEQARQLDVLSKISTGWAPLRASSNDQLLPLREMTLANKLEELERAPSPPKSEIEELKSQIGKLQQRRISLEANGEASAL